MVKLEMFKSLVISTADLIENVTRLNQWLFQKYKSFYLNGINNRLLYHFTSPILRRTFRCVYGNNFVDFEVFLFEHQTISNCWHRYPKPKWNWWSNTQPRTERNRLELIADIACLLQTAQFSFKSSSMILDLKVWDEVWAWKCNEEIRFKPSLP